LYRSELDSVIDFLNRKSLLISMRPLKRDPWKPRLYVPHIHPLLLHQLFFIYLFYIGYSILAAVLYGKSTIFVDCKYSTVYFFIIKRTSSCNKIVPSQLNSLLNQSNIRAAPPEWLIHRSNQLSGSHYKHNNPCSVISITKTSTSAVSIALKCFAALDASL
jgi:hypothetical protein